MHGQTGMLLSCRYVDAALNLAKLKARDKKIHFKEQISGCYLINSEKENKYEKEGFD